ncbi:MAG TPA: hypothetical protein DD990_31470 [Cyanobacteria bacterium UBA11368]|nr:hypothetical protein [Cyanobacteria bacterium UBA11368]
MGSSPRVKVPSEYLTEFCAVIRERTGRKILANPSKDKTTRVRVPQALILEADLAIAEINVEIATKQLQIAMERRYDASANPAIGRINRRVSRQTPSGANQFGENESAGCEA